MTTPRAAGAIRPVAPTAIATPRSGLFNVILWTRRGCRRFGVWACRFVTLLTLQTKWEDAERRESPGRVPSEPGTAISFPAIRRREHGRGSIHSNRRLGGGGSSQVWPYFA